MIKINEKQIEKKPSIIPKYNGLKEWPVTPETNSVIGPSEKTGNLDVPDFLPSLTYSMNV